MAKNRMAVTCNGRAAFYAAMWNDIRQCAMDRGWAVSLHGSLSSDMDIMAMPWIEEAVFFEELVSEISKLFKGNALAEGFSICYNEKPHGRIVATIPIFADFYLDISTMQVRNDLKQADKQIEDLIADIANMPNSVDCIVAEAEYLHSKGWRKQ